MSLMKIVIQNNFDVHPKRKNIQEDLRVCPEDEAKKKVSQKEDKIGQEREAKGEEVRFIKVRPEM